MDKAEQQFRMIRLQIAKPSETLQAQGELSLDTKALLECLSRLAVRVKELENNQK